MSMSDMFYFKGVSDNQKSNSTASERTRYEERHNRWRNATVSFNFIINQDDQDCFWIFQIYQVAK